MEKSRFRAHFRDEGWRSVNLIRQITRGRHKGCWVVEVPSALEGFRKRRVNPEDVACRCCALSMAGMELTKVPGGVKVERE